MAEPQTASPAAAPAKTHSATEKALDKAVEGERRSFETASDAVRFAGQAGSDAAHAGAEATRRVVETTRRTGREISEHWRASVEPFAAAQMELNRWVDDMWRLTTGLGVMPALRAFQPFGAPMGPAALFAGLPPVDVKETARAYTLALELPGLTRQDIDLSLESGSIVVCGHKAEEKADATAAYRISERRFGRFERRFPLPHDADPTRIEASYQDGVLKVTLPKAEDTTSKRSKVEIKG